MEENRSCNQEADCKEVDVVALMRKKLPPYVVNCLVTSGYDSLEVILGMDTSERLGNFIETIERFVEKYHSEGGQISCGIDASIKLPHPFVFPPGHCIMINNFVDEVKKCVQACKKHSLTACESVEAKRKKLQQSGTSDSNQDSNSLCSRDTSVEAATEICGETISSVTRQVRCGISCWVRKQQIYV